MQEAISKQTDIKMTVRKIRRVINLIRGKKASEAQRMRMRTAPIGNFRNCLIGALSLILETPKCENFSVMVARPTHELKAHLIYYKFITKRNYKQTCRRKYARYTRESERHVARKF